ncbi:prepilin peptidase [Bifidobacterium merycicum]|uniref:prepilin peptidase n=2 Tax=Bifidobacterium TaxID=1678 RepID=UPI001F3D5F5A|nr:prepilin peptidase [Bifidobacterium merycicum]
MVHALIGAVVLGAFYLLLALVWAGGMGGGDIKLAVLIGLTLGWLGWPQLIVGAFAAFFVGGIISIVLLALHKVKLRGGIPFGPSMVIGAWIGIYAGTLIANWYLQISGLA